MNKLKMFALMAIAALALVTGALAAAPSASAQRSNAECAEIKRVADNAWKIYRLLVVTGYGNTQLAAAYKYQARVADSMYADEC